jgi:hypothetical protein
MSILSVKIVDPVVVKLSLTKNLSKICHSPKIFFRALRQGEEIRDQVPNCVGLKIGFVGYYLQSVAISKRFELNSCNYSIFVVPF